MQTLYPGSTQCGSPLLVCLRQIEILSSHGLSKFSRVTAPPAVFLDEVGEGIVGQLNALFWDPSCLASLRLEVLPRNVEFLVRRVPA